MIAGILFILAGILRFIEFKDFSAWGYFISFAEINVGCLFLLHFLNFI